MLAAKSIIIFNFILGLEYGPQQSAPELQKPLSGVDHFNISQRLRPFKNEQLITLGTALGLEFSTIQRMNNLPDDMVNAWLIGADNVIKTSGPASWASLITALRKIGQQGIASAIQRDETVALCKIGQQETGFTIQKDKTSKIIIDNNEMVKVNVL